MDSSLCRQGHWADALTVLHLALRTSPAQAQAYFTMAKALAGLQDWPAARQAYGQGLILDRHAPSAAPDLYGLCARIDEGLGDLKSALRNERLELATKDSVRSAASARHADGLQALYSLKSKERDLGRLHGDNLRMEATLKGERLKTGIALGACLLLIALVGLLLFLRKRHLGWLRRTRLRNDLMNRKVDEVNNQYLELERQNIKLKRSLVSEREKDLMTRDVHHCTRDSLQLVSALLQMQGTFAHDPRLEAWLRECQGRIHALSMVHEHLCKSGDAPNVNIKAHFTALASSVLSSRGLADKLSVEFDIDAARIKPDDLMPLSLLLNELLTHSAKVAASSGRCGRILFRLHPLAAHQHELLFTHEGLGPEEGLLQQTGGFNAQLVRTLAHQLNGAMHLLRGDSTTFQFTFGDGEAEEMRMAS